MTERIWDKFLTERDKAVFAAGGFGARAGFGKRPALLVIDVNWAFCGERSEPILESIKRWRTSCGEEAWVALEYIKLMIAVARAKGLPVRRATPSACAICTPNTPMSFRPLKSFPISISWRQICLICRRAVIDPQRR